MRRIIGGTVAAFAIAIAAAGCGSGDDVSSTAAKSDGSSTSSVSGKTVCYLEIVSSHPYATPANESLISTLEAKGVKVIELSAEIDVQRQASQMDQCIAQKADAIVVTAVDSKALAPGLAKAKAAGIPVWMYSAEPVAEDEPYIVGYSGPNDTRSGTIAGEQMTKLLNGKGNIVVIQGVAGLTPTVERLDGFIAAAKKAGADFRILAKPYADYNQQKALTVSRDVLTKYGPEIDGVYSEDDIMAAGFLQALKESGIEPDFPIVSAGGGTKDAFAAIKDGRQHSTVLQPPQSDGQLAAEMVLKILAGDPTEKVAHFDQPLITKDNIDQFQPGY